MNAYKLGLDVLSLTGMARLLRRKFSGVGAVLTLHHVKPMQRPEPFSPNRILEITPDFLEAVVCALRDLDYEFVSLDQFHDRMLNRDFTKKFIAFTLDDGYADNFRHAFPVFARHNVPFAIYLCSGVMDGSANLWWRELEAIVQHSSQVCVQFSGRNEDFVTQTVRDKYRTFNEIYWKLRAMPHDAQLSTMKSLREQHLPTKARTQNEPLDWNMVDEMLSTGLLTIGGHTVNHYALSKLPEDLLYQEIEAGCAAIRTHSGVEATHFAYPFGDKNSAGEREFRAVKELGFLTGVTTRKGVVIPEQSAQLHAVPRISLNGDFQRLRYIRTLMTGLPTGIYQRFRPGEATI